MPPPLPKVVDIKAPEVAATLLETGGEPKGTWREVGGVRCYEAGTPKDGPPVLLIQDAFDFEKDGKAIMQARAR